MIFYKLINCIDNDCVKLYFVMMFNFYVLFDLMRCLGRQMILSDIYFVAILIDMF